MIRAIKIDGEDSWESPGLQGGQSWRRSVLGVHWKDWCWSWSSNTLATWFKELTHWKSPWCWEKLKVGGEVDDTAWDGWMASLTLWTWVWASSGSWWWTGRPGMLQSMGSQTVRYNWATELKSHKGVICYVNEVVLGKPLGIGGFLPGALTKWLEGCTGKGQFSFQLQRKTMQKNAQTTAQLHSSHMLVKQCSKFSKPDFSNTWTVNFQMFKLVLDKAEEPEIKLPTSVGSSKKQESSRNTSTSALLTMPKPLAVWITANCEKFWKRWEYQPTLPDSWEIYMQVKKQ